jgi:hypothetical protein
LATFGETLLFEIPIGPMDCIGIDGDLFHHVPNGWKLVAGTQNPKAESLANLVDDLPIRRDT